MGFNWNTQEVLNQAFSNPVGFLQTNYKISKDLANELLNTAQEKGYCDTNQIFCIFSMTEAMDNDPTDSGENITDQNIENFLKSYNDTEELPNPCWINV